MLSVQKQQELLKKTKKKNTTPDFFNILQALCKARKTIPIWGSLEQIRIVSTVGFYLLNREDG